MKIALLGFGKMGKAIDELAQQAAHEVVLRIDKDNRQDLTADSIKKADVAIEFSQPEAAFENISLCLRNGVPVVSGTTGWLDRFEEAKILCEEQHGAFLYASNFSIGVNLFFALNRYLAQLMDAHDSYGISVEETHHTQKLDAPSGTAITLAEDIIHRLRRKSSWEKGETRTATAVPIISKRVGQVPGTHEIRYHSAIDTITLRHEAHSREGFARGALQAAEWIVGKRGCFGMKDMLGF
jgi:4-hydroxy-tetrahydrodipicolinate reductase